MARASAAMRNRLGGYWAALPYTSRYREVVIAKAIIQHTAFCIRIKGVDPPFNAASKVEEGRRFLNKGPFYRDESLLEIKAKQNSWYFPQFSLL